MMDFIHLNVWLDLIIFITSESFYYCLKVIHYMYLKGILIFVLPVNFQLQDQSTYVYVFHIIGIQTSAHTGLCSPVATRERSDDSDSHS